MLKRICQTKVLLFILMGAIIGAVLFLLGDSKDAPGLSFIGISIAFMLVMRGVYYTRIVPQGYHMPCVFSVFGVVALVFPFILFLDGEITLLSVSAGISFLCVILLLAISLLRARKVKACKL